MSRSRVAVLGGTFDPIHSGHLQIAEHVREALRPERVLLVLSATPPHKDSAALCPAHHREAMLRLALAERPGLELSRLELDARRVCYTIDTLSTLRDGTPPVDPLFILGSDALLELPGWREAERIVAEFDLVAVDRPGCRLDEVRDRLAPELARRLVPMPLAADDRREREAPGRGGRIFHLEFPPTPIPISSSEIRARAADGRSLGGLVPPAVARYILDKGLYRKEERR